jgi:hypothetical protein
MLVTPLPMFYTLHRGDIHNYILFEAVSAHKIPVPCINVLVTFVTAAWMTGAYK